MLFFYLFLVGKEKPHDTEYKTKGQKLENLHKTKQKLQNAMSFKNANTVR